METLEKLRLVGVSGVQEWIVLLAGVEYAEALVVAFAVNRSRIRDVELHLLTHAGTYSSALSENTAAIELPRVGVGKGVLALLRVTFEDDVPLLAAGAWEYSGACANPFAIALPRALLTEEVARLYRSGADDELMRHFVLGSVLERVIPVEVVESGQDFIARHRRPRRDVYEVRRKALARDERTRQFFFQLDYASASARVPREWGSAMAYVNRKLAQRVRVRAMLGRGGDVPIWPRGRRLARRLQIASTFVQTLVVAHLYDAEEGDLVHWAFARFALEGLAVSHSDPVLHRLLLSHGAPDGVAFFRFGELALACVENGIDEDFWAEHLVSLAASAHLYAEMAADVDADGRRFYAYREGRRFPQYRRTEVETKYTEVRGLRPLDAVAALTARFTSLLGQALDERGASPVRRSPLPAEHRVLFEPQNEGAERQLTSTVRFFDNVQVFALL